MRSINVVLIARGGFATGFQVEGKFLLPDPTNSVKRRMHSHKYVADSSRPESR